jgi:hypothetical protein
MKDIILLGKKVNYEKSEVLFKYSPNEDYLKYFTPKSGEWYYEDGYLVGVERGNMGGILFTNEYFKDDVMLTFTVKAQLPATRDLNAVWCAKWDETTDYLGESYVCGLNGWFDNKSGIERNGTKLYSTTSLYKYEPGTEVRLTCGSINGHTFMVVDDVLVTELIDENPITEGHVGFSAYCTILKIKDIEVRKIDWEKIEQSYTPEF